MFFISLATRYDSNGGTGTVTDFNNYLNGDTVKVSESKFTKQGQVQLGFSKNKYGVITSAVGAANVEFVTEFIISENTTLYAVYALDYNDTGKPDYLDTYYTVKFLNKDSKVISTKRVVEGKGVTAPTAPTIDNYNFVEWDKDIDNVTEDLIVNPIYELRPYKLVVNYLYENGSQAAEPYVGYYNEKVHASVFSPTVRLYQASESVFRKTITESQTVNITYTQVKEEYIVNVQAIRKNREEILYDPLDAEGNIIPENFWRKMYSTYVGNIGEQTAAKCTYVPGHYCIEDKIEQTTIIKGQKVEVNVYYLPLFIEYPVKHLFEDPNNLGTYIEREDLAQTLEGYYYNTTKGEAYTIPGYTAQEIKQIEIRNNAVLEIKYDLNREE